MKNKKEIKESIEFEMGTYKPIPVWFGDITPLTSFLLDKIVDLTYEINKLKEDEE